jgi:hypothetical protein
VIGLLRLLRLRIRAGTSQRCPLFTSRKGNALDTAAERVRNGFLSSGVCACPVANHSLAFRRDPQSLCVTCNLLPSNPTCTTCHKLIENLWCACAGCGCEDRPGGYDVLFESLAQQTSKDFELICIDDAGPMDKETGIRAPPARRAAAVAYARKLGIPLMALVPSKKKVRGKRFGQCNAINSGLVLASGEFITVVQDNVWLLPNFVERTLAFFATHDRDALLSYPERRVAPPAGRLNAEWMNDSTSLHIFDPPVTVDPVAAGWEIQNFNNTMTEDIWGRIGEDHVIRTEWFECAACTASWELYAALNGLDEALDIGDDSQVDQTVTHTRPHNTMCGLVPVWF